MNKLSYYSFVSNRFWDEVNHDDNNNANERPWDSNMTRIKSFFVHAQLYLSANLLAFDPKIVAVAEPHHTQHSLSEWTNEYENTAQPSLNSALAHDHYPATLHCHFFFHARRMGHQNYLPYCWFNCNQRFCCVVLNYNNRIVNKSLPLFA